MSAITQECCGQYWTSPGGSTPQSSSCTATSPITKTIQDRRTRHVRHCWRRRDEFISDILLWTPSYGRAKAGRLTRNYIQQFCADTGCSLEDLPEEMDYREGWWERVREIHAVGATWWWRLVCHKSNLKNTFEKIIEVLRFDMTLRLIKSGLSDHLSSPVRAKVECFRSCEHFVSRVTNCSTTRIPSSSRHPRPTSGLFRWGSYSLTEVQSAYFTVPTNRVLFIRKEKNWKKNY